VPFDLLYHPDVARADLLPIPLNVHGRIADAVARRLHEAPERYGHPLRDTLKGYWKHRVGDYRVVIRIVGTEVWILAIIHRRQVYEDVLRRIVRVPVQRGG
jgi:mRNA interferase RelE/StbE